VSRAREQASVKNVDPATHDEQFEHCVSALDEHSAVTYELEGQLEHPWHTMSAVAEHGA